jgi:hypothetical protein
MMRMMKRRMTRTEKKTAQTTWLNPPTRMAHAMMPG